MDEHMRLFRDSFNSFALGCAAFAAFNSEVEPLARAVFGVAAVYSHVVAHVAIAYGRVLAKRQEEARHA